MMMLAIAITVGLGHIATAADAHKKGKGMSHFVKLDTNNDGKVNLEEFTAGKLAKAKKLFVKMDSDNDGSVTTEEMKVAAKARAKKNGGHGKKKKKKTA